MLFEHGGTDELIPGGETMPSASTNVDFTVSIDFWHTILYKALSARTVLMCSSASLSAYM